ncbi:MAG: hypothetical protein AB7T07_01025 [Steroidobacteraceae bacterium]
MHTTLADITSRHAAVAPTVTWSPQQQTARMLALCEAQMEAATQDADAAVDTLVKAFTDLIDAVRELGSLSKTDTGDTTHAQALSEINTRCATLSSQVAAAVVAFQFYDKLSQRLGHVRYSLSTMALFICDRSNSQRPEHWEKLLATLGRLYRTAEERAIFDSIAGSLALTISDQDEPLSKAMSDAGSIELF